MKCIERWCDIVNKNLLLFALVVLMSFYYGTITTSAAEISDDATIESFQSIFDLSDRAMIYTSENSGLRDYSNYLFIDVSEHNNVYGSFSFSSGLERLKFSAFACEKNLIGYGEEGTTVGMLVYTRVGDDLTVLDHKVRTLGASGLFSDEVSFAYNQVQYLVVAVKIEGDVFSHVYEVTTKEEATKALLENFEIKFIAEEAEEMSVPRFDVAVMMGYDF